MALLLKKEEPKFKLGIWKIEEQMSFFADQIPFQSTALHASRQTQQLATRYLLSVLKEDFPFAEIQINQAGKPFIADNKLQFNLSHTHSLAVAILSDTKPVGVDAEKINSRVLKIQHKFINEVEAANVVARTEAEQISILTKYWTIKEAVYKWWGKGSVDFANDICIQSNAHGEEVVKVNFKKEDGIALEVNCFQLDEHWITYVVQ
jgi:phosphopantetheinyl transferase